MSLYYTGVSLDIWQISCRVLRSKISIYEKDFLGEEMVLKTIERVRKTTMIVDESQRGAREHGALEERQGGALEAWWEGV